MDNSSKQKLVNDIENKLDSFFGSDDPEPAASSEAPQPSLEKLKSAVLSIDWEITDACLTDLIAETDALVPHYEDDRTTHAMLRMLHALGRYIRKRKAQAHQDAIKRVMSVFASLEKLITEPQLEEKIKRQIAAKEILAFKNLKQQVEAQRSVAAPAPPQPMAETSGKTDYIGHPKFKAAMDAVEERFNRQVKALKSELADLQKELATLRKS